MTSDIDSEEDFSSESDENKIDRQNEESGYASVVHLKNAYRWVTRTIYNTDYRNKMHNKFTINRVRASNHKYVLYIGDWPKGMDFPYKGNDLMSRMRAAHQLWSFLNRLFPTYTKGKYGLSKRVERKKTRRKRTKNQRGQKSSRRYNNVIH